MTDQLSLFADGLRCTGCGQIARAQVCGPCRSGQHIDHHDGVWDRARCGDPVVCPCERCGGLDAARAWQSRMAAIRSARADG